MYIVSKPARQPTRETVLGDRKDASNYNLGTSHRAITTASDEAQQWFDRGLRWCYGFNFDEGVGCFQRAADHDPTCAMAYWGIAYAIGPNYNRAWKLFDKDGLRASVDEATKALKRATSLAEQTEVRPVEKELIKALTARFPTSVDTIPSDLKVLNEAYANAMRDVYANNSTDIDVVGFFVEALMCISPRELWDIDTGLPSGKHTEEARTVIEKGLASPDGYSHPVLCHLYIHLMEMSPYPEKALSPADRLRHLIPDSSHLLHMPVHIDMAVGDYRRGIDSSQASISADDKYFALSATGGATAAKGLLIAYRMHNINGMLYCAFISGRSQDAIRAANLIESVVDDEILSLTNPPVADWTEGFLGSLAHVYIRFGRWSDILSMDLPAKRSLYPSKTAVILYARGIAYSALGQVENARAAQAEFEASRAHIPPSRMNSLPSKQSDVMAIASAMLSGELLYREGKHEAAFETLRHAIALEDALPYADPPPWMQPVRHALGGLLLEQGRVEQAEDIFREDVGMKTGFPRRKARLNNVWGLHGLHECFVKLGKLDQAQCIEPIRDVALGGADVDITTSCYCRLSAVESGPECQSRCC